MKRFAIIAHGLSDGGAERVASMVANHYVQNGYDVLYLAVFCPDREYALDDRVTYRYIKIPKCTKATRFLRRSFEIDRQIREFKADMALSFIEKESVITNLRKTVPIIYTLRNDPTHLTENPTKRAIMLFSYKRAKQIVFQTQGAMSFFPAEIQEKGTVIANPLTRNLPYWDPNNHEKRIITACRLNKQKNLPMLINAFSIFHSNHPDYRLEIYGKGSELDSLKKLCGELKLEDCVHFMGYTDKIHSIMASSAAFVLSSNFEGLSNSMLEALAIGIPTVCTDCPPGGAAEYITDGANGFLVPVGDVNTLADKLEWLASDSALCQKMSWQAAQVRQKLNPERILLQWEQILNA